MIKTKSSQKILGLMIILLIIIIGTMTLSGLCVLRHRTGYSPVISQPEPKGQITTTTISSNPLDLSNNDFPFPLSAEQIDSSLMDGKAILISPVEKDWEDNINSTLKQKGWKLIGLDRAEDGGSTFYYYFKTKDVPALWLGYHWNLMEGKYVSLGVKFVHPSQIGSWLLQHKLSLNKNVNIESLMDCPGSIHEIRPGVAECVKK